MPVNVDLHVHTRFSGDSNIYPKAIVEKLHADNKIKGVAITDHDTTQGINSVRRLAEPYNDIVIIPGVEMTTQQGHLIILGIEETLPPPLTVWEAVDFGMEQGGAIIAPHPFRPISGLGETLYEVPVHAIEVLNSHSTNEENNSALELSKIKGTSATAGSDCHSIGELLSAYTKVDSEATVDEILNAIKKGNVKPYTPV
ncbi:MAG TPA: PHP domain-containing protein [archaeon]|nr:PHP domain-containing protein [archaeon]